MNIARWIFSISLFLGLFWVLGFVLEAATESEPSIIILTILAFITTAIFCLLLFKTFHNFLKKEQVENIPALKYYIISVIASYFLLVPIFGVIAYVFVLLKEGTGAQGAGIAITLLALWFPLWWFVPVGLTVGWFLYKRTYHKNYLKL